MVMILGGVAVLLRAPPKIPKKMAVLVGTLASRWHTQPGGTDRTIVIMPGRCLARAGVGARDEDGVDAMDDAVVAIDVGGPVGGLGGALGLEANDGVVEPVLAELAVGSQGAALERDLVRVEAVEGFLARDDVVLEDVRGDRRADLLGVLVERSVRGREEGVLAVAEVDARGLELAGESPEHVVALDLVLLVADEDAVRAPEDLRALEARHRVDDAGVERRRRARRGHARRREGRGTSSEAEDGLVHDSEGVERRGSE